MSGESPNDKLARVEKLLFSARKRREAQPGAAFDASVMRSIRTSLVEESEGERFFMFLSALCPAMTAALMLLAFVSIGGQLPDFSSLDQGGVDVISGLGLL